MVHMLLKLKVINLFAGPGAGKSTTAAGLFNLMKTKGHRVELVTEYAKDLTYEKNYATLQHQLLILAEQDFRLRRLEGQVEWAVTDSPLPLGIVYTTPEYDDWLPEAALAAYDRYDNHAFLIRRVKAYQRYGRTQSEPAALAIDAEVRGIFKDATVPGLARGNKVLEVAGTDTAHITIYRELFGHE